MKYSVMVEYALHSLVHLINIPSQTSVGIKELAEFQGLSETYLSKVFSKLTKAKIVDSVPGVKGGYKLAKAPDEISFLEVIRAVEGIKPIFQCNNIIAKAIYNTENEQDESCDSCPSKPSGCLINRTMLAAEKEMHDFLEKKSLAWLDVELDTILGLEERAKHRAFFNDNSK